MADYQLAHLSLSTRVGLVFRMLNPQRPWGQVTALSREYGVSRKFLYELREKAISSIVEGLLPHQPDRKAASNQVEVDDHFVRRAIGICMSIVPGTVRTVQSLLELLFGVHSSIGYISQIAKQLRADALEYSQDLSLPLRALDEADDSLYTSQPVDFSVGFLSSFPNLAKLLVAFPVLVIILVAALIWFILRRVRRRKAEHGTQQE